MKIFQREQRSLFGEILDWMLTPLLLLWPVSLALTWLVAQSIAGKPFDRALEYNVQALAQLVTVQSQKASGMGAVTTDTTLLPGTVVYSLDLVVVQDGLPLVGWTSVEGMLKDRFARYKDVQIRLKDIQVVALGGGTSAVATASMTRELGDGVTTITESGALTLVLRKEGDLWLIVAEHYSYKRNGS